MEQSALDQTSCEAWLSMQAAPLRLTQVMPAKTSPNMPVTSRNGRSSHAAVGATNKLIEATATDLKQERQRGGKMPMFPRQRFG